MSYFYYKFVDNHACYLLLFQILYTCILCPISSISLLTIMYFIYYYFRFYIYSSPCPISIIIVLMGR